MEGKAAGEGPAARCGVAWSTIGSDREISSPRDEAGLAQLGRHAGGIRARIHRQGNAPPAGEIHRAGLEKHPARDHQYDRGNDGGGEQKSSAYRTCRAHADFLPAKISRSIGSLRSLIPVAAKMALQTAGGAAVVPVSPIPPGASSL